MSEGDVEFSENPEVSSDAQEEAYLLGTYQQQYLDRLLGTSHDPLSAESLKSFQKLATELAEEKRAYEKRYMHDRLMDNLLTRAGLDDELTRVFTLKQRQSDPKGVLMFLDVDHLKNTNDKYGHKVGDAALTAVDDTVGEVTRRSDVRGRYGGDEVVIFLEDADIRGAAVVATRARETLVKKSEELRNMTDGQGRVSFSIGLVPYRQGMSVAQALREADEAMYVAKHQLNRDAIAITGLTDPKVIEETHEYLRQQNINAPIVGVPLAREGSAPTPQAPPKP